MIETPVQRAIKLMTFPIAQLRQLAYESADKPNQKEANEHFRGWDKAELVTTIMQEQFNAISHTKELTL